MFCTYFVGSDCKGTDVTYLCRMFIYFILFLFLEPHVVMVQRLFIFPCIYFFLFILHFGMENRTLSQIYGRFYLPIFYSG